jgi:hypothetical protein
MKLILNGTIRKNRKFENSDFEEKSPRMAAVMMLLS